ncbi:MAG: DUF1572 domain-containing protein [Flavobacterium sp.]|nr:MAG: DUF1572 domain-containing protein [Flavobacterium sp.]
MTTSQETASRFREIFLDGTWVANTNYKKELEGTDWNLATASYGSLNTVSVLAQHINYYLEGVLKVFQGGNLDISDKYSFDFAPVKSQKNWDDFLIRFFNNAEEFALQIESMSEDKLRGVFVDEKYGSIQRNIDGMIEHAYYHLGQIVILKKLSAGV